ncbi:MAG TPA: outer membrane beta-barrel protein [Hanamia sp.]|nr:outer membrane beta-barrel protein [Hanamia sp.]
MKKIALGFMGVLFAMTSMAQTDSVQVQKKNDTIRIGGMIILKKGDTNDKRVTVTVGNRNYNKKSNINTASFIIDLGFANWVDKTNYATATAGNYLVTKGGTPDLGENDFKLKTIKSVNVNIWFFMQRLNLIKHYVNLKYGLGLELNNYRFKSALSLDESGINPYTQQSIDHSFIFRDSISFSKNKLAADYVTIPFMLNFMTNPNSSKKGLSLSAGVSVGYLYDSRNKQISSDRGKLKNHGDYDLEKWKFCYIAELGLGPAHLYGSYSPNSIFQKGLNLMPYSVGIRFSNW